MSQVFDESEWSALEEIVELLKRQHESVRRGEASLEEERRRIEFETENLRDTVNVLKTFIEVFMQRNNINKRRIEVLKEAIEFIHSLR